MKDKFCKNVILNLFQNPFEEMLKRVQHDKIILLLIAILLVGAFLRLYKISDYMTFLGDEGRDVLIVKQMIVDHKFTLLGPTASVGGFFLGPIYYYFMLPFLWLWQLDPTGPAVMVALFGTATIYLVYLLGKEFFSEKTGLIAAGLYAASPLVIAYSRSSWNPNPMPFFSAMTLFCLYKGLMKKSKSLLFSSGVFLGITMQLHYLAVFLVVIMITYVALANAKLLNFKLKIKNYFLLLSGFLLGLSPFLAFEIRHGFPNTQTILKFIFNDGKDTGFTGRGAINILSDLFFRLFWRLLTHYPSFGEMNLWQDPTISKWIYGIVILAVLSLVLFIWQRKNLLLFLWLFLGIGLFIFYKKPIYDYYLSFLFPLPFLLVANFISKTKILGLIILALFIYNSLEGVYLRYPPNRQMEQTKTIARFVYDQVKKEPYNFALVAPGNSDHAYRYFLEIWGEKPVAIENFAHDPQRKTVTGQLLIICEDSKCQPLGHPLWEIAGFGPAEIAQEWNVSFVKVFKLIHYQEEK